ncbi:hypothetical protein V4B17_00085 [Bartonella sp. B23]
MEQEKFIIIDFLEKRIATFLIFISFQKEWVVQEKNLDINFKLFMGMYCYAFDSPNSLFYFVFLYLTKKEHYHSGNFIKEDF